MSSMSVLPSLVYDWLNALILAREQLSNWELLLFSLGPQPFITTQAIKQEYEKSQS